MEKNEILRQIKPCNMDEPFVFVSYSSLDSQRVWEDVLQFQKLGYNVWLDERNLNKTKQSWRLDALEAICDINCSLLVFYVSRHSLVSQACFAELQSTVEETTQATHNGPVKFVAVDAEPIDDIIQFQQEVYTQVRSNREISKEEKTNRLVTLRKCIDQFFDSNNEKVRVKALGIPNRKMDYYEEIVAAFPDETRVCENWEPAAEKEPAPEKREKTPVPVVKPRPSEILDMPYDFLEDIWQTLEDKDKKRENKQASSKVSANIPLAKARWEKKDGQDLSFTIIDTHGGITLAYMVEEFLVPSGECWTLFARLRLLPVTTDVDNEGNPKRTFALKGNWFTHEDCNILLLSIHKDRSKALVNSALITYDDKMYVSKKPMEMHPHELDESGYRKDSGMEDLFAFCDIESTDNSDFWQPDCWRRSVSQFKPEYLRYLILDMRTQEEIPKSFSRNAKGEYQLSMVLPCPGRFTILEITCDGPEYVNESYAVAGYLHGAYGLKKNPATAERLMREKAEEADAAMAFEYGAFLRKEGKTEEAEKYLRMAAQNGEAGAKFELAELLLERSEQDSAAREEARQLIDELWAQGCRTYGPEKSIDLLGEHRQCEA